MGRWLKKITGKATPLTDKPDTMGKLSTMSGLSVSYIGISEKNIMSKHSILREEFDEHYIKQFYKTKCASYIETGLSESEAQHQALNELALRFIDLTQVSYDSLELWNFGQKLYKACGIPLMKD